MKRVLIVDNNLMRESWGSRALNRMCRISGIREIVIRRGPHRDLPQSDEMHNFDRVVVSGSAASCLDESEWTKELDKLIKETIEKKIPILGVCYGHQALVRALGSRDHLRKGSQCEFGWVEIQREVRPESRLFKGLPDKFYSFGAHFEEASRLPEGFVNLARSDRCSIQAFESLTAPIFGIQFHPERDVASASKTFKEMKAQLGSKELLKPHDSEKLYDPTIGETIFRNFLGEIK